jgi:hypothetical protein
LFGTKDDAVLGEPISGIIAKLTIVDPGMIERIVILLDSICKYEDI